MNSCFARSEQQARPLWRNKPVGVTPVNVPGGSVIAPSVELKKLGGKTGIKNWDAKLLSPEVIITESNPPLYRQMHREFRELLLEFSPDVEPMSIDECLINMRGCPALKQMTMEEVGYEIKQRVYKTMGCWMSISVGIGTNWFHAKTAAGLVKPNGLNTLTYHNLREVLGTLKLTDLCGISTQNELRLHAAGVTTPLEFLDAEAHFLSRQVFGSIHGLYWYRRLRGYQEVTIKTDWQKGFSASVMLGVPVWLNSVLLGVIQSLGLRASTKMRRKGHGARYVQLIVLYSDFTHTREYIRLEQPIWLAPDIFRHLALIYSRQSGAHSRFNSRSVRKLIVFLGDAVPGVQDQISLFEVGDTWTKPSGYSKDRRITEALDAVNLKYGSYVLGTGWMASREVRAHNHDRIPFGTASDVEELYADEEVWSVPMEFREIP